MLQPLGDRILIRPEENPTQTDTGLHLVEEAQPETSGVVIATPRSAWTDCPDCGRHVERNPCVQTGDTVVFSHKSGQEIQVDGTRYLIMRESDILAVLEGVTL